MRAEKLRDAILERAVDIERAADKAHRRRARAVLAQALDPRLDDFGLIGEPEVVVAREHDHVAGFFHVHFGRHRRGEVPQVLVRAGLLQRVELGLQLGIECMCSLGKVPFEVENDLRGFAAAHQFESAVEFGERQARA